MDTIFDDDTEICIKTKYFEDNNYFEMMKHFCNKQKHTHTHVYFKRGTRDHLHKCAQTNTSSLSFQSLSLSAELSTRFSRRPAFVYVWVHPTHGNSNLREANET